MSKDTAAKFWADNRTLALGERTQADPPVPVPLSLLLALKAQIEADAVELESTTRWCRDLPALIAQDAMPETWDRLVALLREAGYAP